MPSRVWESDILWNSLPCIENPPLVIFLVLLKKARKRETRAAGRTDRVHVFFPQDLDELTGSSFEPPLPDSRTRIVPEKAEFELTCLPVAGNPPVRVWWLDPRGHTVTDSGPVRVDESRLIIEAARAVDDSGNYTCVAENMAGTRMASFKLVVSSKCILQVVFVQVTLVACRGCVPVNHCTCQKCVKWKMYKCSWIFWVIPWEALIGSPFSLNGGVSHWNCVCNSMGLRDIFYRGFG